MYVYVRTGRLQAREKGPLFITSSSNCRPFVFFPKCIYVYIWYQNIYIYEYIYIYMRVCEC